MAGRGARWSWDCRTRPHGPCRERSSLGGLLPTLPGPRTHSWKLVLRGWGWGVGGVESLSLSGAHRPVFPAVNGGVPLEGADPVGRHFPARPCGSPCAEAAIKSLLNEGWVSASSTGPQAPARLRPAREHSTTVGSLWEGPVLPPTWLWALECVLAWLGLLVGREPLGAGLRTGHWWDLFLPHLTGLGQGLLAQGFSPLPRLVPSRCPLGPLFTPAY